MAQRVLTGCRDCVKCNTANVVKGARNLGRGFMAVLTVGGSEMGMALTGTCGTCGHQRSLHRQTGEQRRQDASASLEQRRAAAQAAFQEANHARVLEARAEALATPRPVSDDVREINEMLARAKARANKSAGPETVAMNIKPETAEKVLPPPGFYSDPKPDPSQLRWWDGTAWTAFTKPKR